MVAKALGVDVGKDEVDSAGAVDGLGRVGAVIPEARAWSDGECDVLINLMPGASREGALQGLHEAANALVNASGRTDRYVGYVQWVNSTLAQLRHLIQYRDLEALLLTPRYWILVAASPGYTGPTTAVAALLDVELDERRREFDNAIAELRERINHWSGVGFSVLPDTSFYVQRPEKMEDWDIAPVLPVTEEPVRIVVPMVVVDELDRLKEHSKPHTRWRAGHSLGVLDRIVGAARSPGMLKPEDRSPLAHGGIPRGEVTVEIILDQPGHVRLADHDDEIIDRAFAVQGLAARAITLLTYDTGQSMRARHAGLNVVRFRHPVEDEPEPVGKGGGRRLGR
jgi:hypothetical protein